MMKKQLMVPKRSSKEGVAVLMQFGVRAELLMH